MVDLSNQGLPPDDSWMGKFADFFKRVGVGFAGGPDDIANLLGAGSHSFEDDTSGPIPSVTDMLRTATNTPPPTNFAERLPEGIGNTLFNVPISGGPIGQTLNAGLSIGAPEAINALTPHPDDDIASPAPQHDDSHLITPTASDTPEPPFSPRYTAGGGETVPGDADLGSDPSWLEQITSDKRYQIGAATVGAFALSALAKKAISFGSAAALESRIAGLAQVRPEDRLASIGSGLDAAFADRNAPLKDVWSGFNPTDAEFNKARVDLTMNAAPMNIKINESLKTGELPKTSIKMFPFADWLTLVGKQIGQQVDPNFARVESAVQGLTPGNSGIDQFNTYALAKNELNIRDAAKTSWMNQTGQQIGVAPHLLANAAPDIRPGLHALSTPELRAIAIAGDANPAFNAALDMHKQMMSPLLDFLQQRGMKTAQEVAEMRRDYPDFVPIRQGKEDPSGFWQRFIDPLMPQVERARWDNMQSLMSRTLTDKGSLAGDANQPIKNIFEATNDYIQGVLHYTETNDIHRDFFNDALNWQSLQPQRSSTYFKRVGPDQASDPSVFSYRSNGNEHWVQVNDPQLVQVLQNGPLFSAGIFNTVRNLYTMGTTGALNPAFSLKNLMHMTQRGMMFREPGTAFGLVDSGMQRAGDALERLTGSNAVTKGLQFGLPGDPTSYLGMASGVATNLYGHALYGGASTLRQSMQNDGWLSKVLGPGATKWLADTTWDAYLRSTLHGMHMGGEGFAGGRAGMETADSLNTISSLAPAFTGNPGGLATAYSTWDKIVNSIRHGAEAHYHLINDRAGVTASDQVINSALARDLGGDVGKTGANSAVRFATGTVPYANIDLQGNMRILRAFVNNPISSTVGMVSGIGMPAYLLTSWLVGVGDQARDEYYKLTPQQRTSNVYLPIPGLPSEKWPAYPLAAELRGYWAAAMTMMDSVFGLSSKVIDHQDNRDIKSSLSSLTENMHMRDVVSGLTSQFLPDAPPALNIALGMFGKKWAGFGDGNPIQDVHDGVDNLSTTNQAMPAVVKNTIDALFGQIGQIYTHSMNSFYQAWKGSGDLGSAIEQSVGEVGKQFARTLPMLRDPETGAFGGLWDVNQRLSSRNADSAMLQQKLDAIKHLQTEGESQLGEGGMTTRAGEPLTIAADGIQDLDLRGVMGSLQALQQKTLRGLLDQRANSQSQISQINNSTKLNDDNRLSYTNYHTKKIEETNRAALDAIHVWEDQMTASHPHLAARMGGKIKLEKLVNQR